jgi:hypothetical protein
VGICNSTIPEWRRDPYSAPMLDNAKTLAKLGCCALCCLAAAVHAAPPPGVSGGGLLQRASGLLAAKPPGNPASRLDLQRLDLRAPENLAAERAPTATDDSASAFPSAKRARIVPDSRPEEDLPALGGGAAIHSMSRVQEMAQRVQREGVPLARLWETRSALLHVGLSPRGKPGLWLIQKVH